MKIRIEVYFGDGTSYQRVLNVRTVSHNKAIAVGRTLVRKKWRELGSTYSSDGRMYSVTIL